MHVGVHGKNAFAYAKCDLAYLSHFDAIRELLKCVFSNKRDFQLSITSGTTMTPEEFTKAKEALGLNNATAARWLVKSRRTIIRYQYPADDPRNSPIPRPVVDVIRHWLKERGIILDQEGWCEAARLDLPRRAGEGWESRQTLTIPNQGLPHARVPPRTRAGPVTRSSLPGTGSG